MKLWKKLSLLALVLVAVSLTACGGQEVSNDSPQEGAGKSIKVGILQTAEHVALDHAREGFLEGLKEQGIEVEEQTVNGAGDLSVFPAAVNNFVSDEVDLIYAIGTPAAQAAMNGTQDIPVLFSAVTDPVKTRLVDNVDAPEGNVTGVSDYFPMDIQLKNFLEVFPETKTLGVLYSTGEANSEVQIEILEEVVAELGITLEKVGVASTNEVPQAIESLTGKVDAYMGLSDNLASTSVSVIAKILEEKQIPSVATEGGPVENGLLMSDGVDYVGQGKAAAELAAEILDGKTIAELPVIFIEEGERTVNGKTAKALGVEDNEILNKDANIVE
ncbi:MAG: ABC transporter substrate-binding protein [Tissierellia bacterium]|nr:ABC transporter substrate-binding protein [Tissierellia bacterium]